MHRAHSTEPKNLEALEKLLHQYIDADFPEQPVKSMPSIVLKRSTFVLEDGAEDVEDVEVADGNGSPRIYLSNNEEDALWRRRLAAEGSVEADGTDKARVKGDDNSSKKGSGNFERLARFFGEAPEEGYQFAPQPPNVKKMKLKKIFGEAVDTSRNVGPDPEAKEYNKRYRDSLSEGTIFYILNELP